VYASKQWLGLQIAGKMSGIIDNEEKKREQ